MKKIEAFILESCGFTVMLTLISYAIVAMTNLADKQLSILKFLAILGYGVAIAAARALYRYLPFHKAACIMMHYSILLVGFLILYLSASKARGVSPAKVFIAIILFSILYTLFMLAASGVHRLLQRLEKPEDKNTSTTSKKQPAKSAPTKSAYNPRFGSNSK